MKPNEKKPETVFRIIDRATGAVQSSYSRAYCDEYDFPSPESARNANCHGLYADKAKFAIAKYRVTYELIEDDVDPPTEEDIARFKESEEERKAILEAVEQMGPMTPLQKIGAILQVQHKRAMFKEYLRLAKDRP